MRSNFTVIKTSIKITVERITAGSRKLLTFKETSEFHKWHSCPTTRSYHGKSCSVGSGGAQHTAEGENKIVTAVKYS